ncbi:MAG: acyltransferase, partial [Pseudomonas sp.]|nr:acyltransferase [Pseudomonas sp.]
MSVDRSDWVDYAKGLGIILVVYAHVVRGLVSAGFDVPSVLSSVVDSIVYSFHMPLFFFLSGLFFIDSLKRRSLDGMLFSKLDTIIYPYIVWSLFQGGIEVILSTYTNGHVTFAEVLTLWEPRAQFWFLYALFLIFLVWSVIYAYLSSKYTILIFSFASFLYLVQSWFDGVYWLSVLVKNSVFFMFGVVFREYNLYQYLSSRVGLVCLTLAFVSGQYLFHFHYGYTHTDKGISLLVLALVSISFTVSFLIRFRSRLLAYIGGASMAIYLMHILAGSGVRVILNKFFIVDELSVHIVVGTLAGIILPLIALKVIGFLKIPY